MTLSMPLLPCTGCKTPSACLGNRACVLAELAAPARVGFDHAQASCAADGLLDAIGEAEREALIETPARFAKAWEFWTKGYRENLDDLLKTFGDGADGYDEFVIETDVPVYSHCEHHMAPIFGVAHVGYIPSGRIVGLSKIVRLVDHFARRLQVQERLTVQIAEALSQGLGARGVGVVLQCRHMCMESRGVNRPGVITSTSCLLGVLRDKPDARAEFLGMVHNRRSV